MLFKDAFQHNYSTGVFDIKNRKCEQNIQRYEKVSFYAY